MRVKKYYTEEEQKIIDEKNNRYWNINNIMPTVQKGYELWQETEAQLQYLCFIIANGVPSETDRLYRECDLYDVYYKLMLKKAYEF